MLVLLPSCGLLLAGLRDWLTCELLLVLLLLVDPALVLVGVIVGSVFPNRRRHSFFFIV